MIKLVKGLHLSTYQLGKFFVKKFKTLSIDNTN